MLEVVAGVVFAEGGHVVEDGSVGEHGFKADAISVERVVANKVDATCVGRKVSSYLAGSSRPNVQRHRVATLA